MIRKVLMLGSALALAGCAAKAPPPVTAPRPAPVVRAAPPAPRPVRPPPNFNGMAPETLRARLGTPAFSRKDGATDMWRYDSGACRVFFFFTAGKVNLVQTTPAASDGTADPACLIALPRKP